MVVANVWDVEGAFQFILEPQNANFLFFSPPYQQLTDRKLTRKEEEDAIRRCNALERNDLEDLRKVSRQEYLKKREQKKLEEIREDIEDEQYLVDGVKLTEAEYRQLSYKKQIYELVKMSDEVEDTTEYRMPDAYDEEGGVNQEKRFSVAVQCYRFRPAFGASFIWLAGLIYFPRFHTVLKPAASRGHDC